MKPSRGSVLAGLATLLAGVLVALAAGCGGGDDEADENVEATTSVGAAESTGSGTEKTGSGDGGVALQRVGEFDQPTHVAQAPGTNDLYVVERPGRLRIVRDGETLEQPALDLSAEVSDEGQEQGMLSVAFDPDFASSRLLYVYFTGSDQDQHVVEFRAGDDGVVEEGSRREVLRMDDFASNHNGGLLLFGPDGHLYIGTGDGGIADDPERNGQDLGSLLGKLLRIDPTPTGDRPYGIPPDNPFVGRAGARPEVYSYGLRNPWRFSFDRESGALTIADVGQNSLEEVDYTPAGEARGANFGWSAFEGTERFNEDQEAPGAVPPILTYGRDGGCSITGGYVVRDPSLPSLAGRYLYGDYLRRRAAELRAKRPRRPRRPAAGPGGEQPQLIRRGRRRPHLRDFSRGAGFQTDRRMKSLLALTLGAALLLPQAATAALPPTGDGSGGFGLTPIGSFNEPVEIVDAPGTKNRKLLFVAEQAGRIVVLRNGVPQPAPFLDISPQVMNGGEEGLLSIAFHPRYERNRRLYVYFTNLQGDNEVVEFKRSKRSRLVANPATARRVLYLAHPTFGNHNGGQLQFGPRGLLFIGPGDGGGGGDPPNNAQNPNSPLGKLLRIDPLPQGDKKKGKGKKGRAAKAPRPYGIPRGNPFVGQPGLDEIYSLGLRNPYRFTFDSLTGAIAIGDVGQGCREEIDYRGPGGARGANFGWSRFEGTFLSNSSRPAPGAISPILEYDNAGAGPSCSPLGGFSGGSVIAGYVVRDPRLGHQYARLLYADFSSDEIRSLIPSQGGAGDDQYTGVSVPAGQPDSFGETRGGVLWVVSHSGAIYRLDPA